VPDQQASYLAEPSGRGAAGCWCARLVWAAPARPHPLRRAGGGGAGGGGPRPLRRPHGQRPGAGRGAHGGHGQRQGTSQAGRRHRRPARAHRRRARRRPRLLHGRVPRPAPGHDRAFDAVAVHYAALDEEQAGSIHCSVLLHLAERDEFDPPEVLEQFVAALRAAGTPVEARTRPAPSTRSPTPTCPCTSQPRPPRPGRSRSGSSASIWVRRSQRRPEGTTTDALAPTSGRSGAGSAQPYGRVR
jgi:hypothetical protein